MLIGTPPCPRQGHASCVVGHNLIVQGGFYFDDVEYKKRQNDYGTFLKVNYLINININIHYHYYFSLVI
jgi:hypothetical protein